MSEKNERKPIYSLAVVGFGNIGKAVFRALKVCADMRCVAVFTRRKNAVKSELDEFAVFDLYEDPPKKMKIDAAILCGGSKDDIPLQGPYFAAKYNTVDSYDTHARIPEYFEIMDKKAKEAGNLCCISTGWDPGIFSYERALADAFLPGGKIYTFWGRGISQGHSDAVRTVEGVEDARQYTIPIESAMERIRKGETPHFTARQMHKRLVYVVAKPGYDPKKIRDEIVQMPYYFDQYDTEVIFISKEELLREHSGFPHGGFVLASGITGENHREVTEYRCQLDSNPEFTANVLLAYARAVIRLHREGKRGAITVFDIAPKYLSPYDYKELLSKFL